MRKMPNGFTLVELMVTIAVAAILLTVGVPSLKSLYDAYRGNSEISRIQQALSFARNQAISYGAPVAVCPNNNGTSCGSDWQSGLLIYATTTADTATVSKVLKVVEGFNSSDRIAGGKIVFRPDGLTSNTAQVSFIYCPNGERSGSRSINVSSSGMIRYGDDDQTCGS
ncbi:GspH/FimT family pseudopilin [Shewanella sp. C32]|uniref:Type II secretion system protein H n=1 Tax=Shewanella electrica TaxID=515560 RepID=A0ABT2FIY6_9GAMM|nr:GspH/FimT family pseudopilin [Shewanella electrica]MCH1924384.1 GspH/FimT family pseudopilin [Shewanella electrica]MCS4556285.1 GspH/FimT family pseudopilin [Shewanella electrica]